MYNRYFHKSSKSNTLTVFDFSIVSAVMLALGCSCFKYPDCISRVIIQASDIAKRLGNNVLVIL